MIDLTFPASVKAALKGADVVLILAPERQLKAGWLSKAVPAPWVRLLESAAADTAAGPGGTAVSAQNPDEGPSRIVLGVLPDERSRHTAPARIEAAATLAGGAALGKGGKAAVIACLEDPAHALPVARAVGRALPLYNRGSEKPKKGRVAFAAVNPDGRRVAVKPADQAVVKRARWAAWLVDQPTSEMNTSDFVKAVRKVARGIPHLKVKVISGDAVLAKGLGGLHAVGRTAVAAHPPKLLLLEYRPPKARLHVGLVGKGVMYDTGGLNIKTGPYMAGMKHDMGGAAAVMGAAIAMAESGVKEAFTCAAGLVENAIGPDAYRPDDILDMHSGHTVEINNTDAEGRLVLADVASYLGRTYDLDLIVDMATLTGAQLIATGIRHAGIVSNRAGLEQAAVAAGLESGDMTFPMPFAPEYFQQEFRSKVADMKNSVANRMNAQSSCAAQFVYSHIDDLDIPWLHVDIAGPASRDERGTGFGVALAAALSRRLKKSDLAE